MTVSYTAEVATSSGVGCFLKLLRRWRGSIYKLVWTDLVLFLGIYYSLNVTYLFFMDSTTQIFFRRVVKYCATNGNLIPLSFVLGFYVNIVFTRWWTQYCSIPFPDNLSILVGASIQGEDERSRIVRRTIVRYVCTTFTMTLTLMSPKVKKRFPTLNHYVDAGLLLPQERKLIEGIDEEFPSYTKYWLPLAWASSITTRARNEGIIRNDLLMKSILDELNTFRSKCGGILDYDWISIPLVYTQVVTLAVYGYFLITVIGNQFIESSSQPTAELIFFSFPFMPIVEFFFYMGWLKVAETLINPFGEDDDDFEVMWMIDRHVQVCYLLVDRIHQDHPKLVKDVYWDVVAPMSLPFTVASRDYFKECPESSTRNVNVKRADQDLIMPEFVTQTDAEYRNSDAKFRNRKFLRGRTMRSNIPLKRVVSHDIADDATSDNELPWRETNFYSMPELDGDAGDPFENLRQERLDEHKRRLLKHVQLLKAKSGKEPAAMEELFQ